MFQLKTSVKQFAKKGTEKWNNTIVSLKPLIKLRGGNVYYINSTFFLVRNFSFYATLSANCTQKGGLGNSLGRD